MSKMNPKHKSKLQLGFEKQVARQDNKPEIKYIEVVPHIKTWDEEACEWTTLKRCVWNNKWNGMNLKRLCNSFTPVQPGWFGSWKSVSKDGKYGLSVKGKQALNKKKKRKGLI